jgi:hypothetical protein
MVYRYVNRGVNRYMNRQLVRYLGWPMHREQAKGKTVRMSTAIR